MRILLLSHLFAHNTANTERYRVLAQYWSSVGYHVDIIGYKNLSPEVILSEGVTYYSIFTALKFTTLLPFIGWSIIEFAKIISNRKSYLKIRSGVCNGAIRVILNKLLKRYPYDVIIIGILPWTHYSFLPYLKKFAPLILDVSDPLYKNAYLDREQIGFEKCKLLEQKAFSCVEKVILMSEPLLDMYAHELHIPMQKMIFISPSISLSDRFDTQKVICKIPSANIKLLYAGTIYPGYRDIEELQKAVRNCRACQVEIVSNLARQSDAQLIYTNWLSKSDLYKKYQACDILVFVDNFFGYQVPSKIFELLLMRKPILFVYDERNKYFYNLLKDQKGIFFVINDCYEIEKTIREIIGLKEIHVEYDYDLYPYGNTMMCHKYEKCIAEAIGAKVAF